MNPMIEKLIETVTTNPELPVGSKRVVELIELSYKIGVNDGATTTCELFAKTLGATAKAAA